MHVIDTLCARRSLQHRRHQARKADAMRVSLAPLLLAAALGLGPAAYAAEQPTPPTGPIAMPAPGMMGGGMMGPGMMDHRMMDMGAMHCVGMSDERLASAKAELAITNAQLPVWNAFAETVKANAQVMGREMMQGPGAQPGSGMMMAPGTLPERLERHEKMMSAHLEALRKTRAAVARLYSALTPDQRSKADRILCGQMGGPGAGAPPPANASPEHLH
jgi:hypothetical protein